MTYAPDQRSGFSMARILNDSPSHYASSADLRYDDRTYAPSGAYPRRPPFESLAYPSRSYFARPYPPESSERDQHAYYDSPPSHSHAAGSSSYPREDYSRTSSYDTRTGAYDGQARHGWNTAGPSSFPSPRSVSPPSAHGHESRVSLPEPRPSHMHSYETSTSDFGLGVGSRKRRRSSVDEDEDELAERDERSTKPRRSSGLDKLLISDSEPAYPRPQLNEVALPPSPVSVATPHSPNQYTKSELSASLSITRSPTFFESTTSSTVIPSTAAVAAPAPAPKGRSRAKPKAKARSVSIPAPAPVTVIETASSASSPNADSYACGDAPDDLVARRQKNTEAARRSRQRKRDQMSSLEEKTAKLEAETLRLQMECDFWREKAEKLMEMQAKRGEDREGSAGEA